MLHAVTVAAAALIVAQSPIHRSPAAARPLAFPVAPATPPEGGARYHTGATLICSDCHVMHASEQHALDGTMTRDVWPLPWAGAPNRTLLRRPSPNELCVACHDGIPGVPDVIGADVNQLPERSAGELAGLGVPNPRGHTLAAGDPDGLCNRCHAGGSMATATVACIDCHGPHGNGFFRNLQWASAPGQEPEIRAFTRPGAQGLLRYAADNVRYPAPSSSGSAWREVTNVCIDCHHAFMDDAGAAFTKPGGMAHWGRHPGTNSEWGARRPIDAPGANTTPDNWVSGTVGFGVPRLKFVVEGAADFDAAGLVATNNQVFCLTCHRAHGSSNPFALRWDYGSTSPTRSAGCLQCHREASGQ
ncbi:MAG TPA: cytochrome c3 family protein [Anaeromyxobacter sp.]